MDLIQSLRAALRYAGKTNIKNPVNLLISLGLSIGMILGMTAINDQAYNITPEKAVIKAALNDNGNVAGGEVFRSMLAQADVQELIELSEDPDIQIILAEDFDERLKQGEKTRVTVNEMRREGMLDASIIQFMTVQVGELLSRGHVYDRLISDGALTEETAQSLALAIEGNYQTSAFERISVEPLRTLSSYEQQSAAVYSLLFFFMVIFGMFQGYFKDRESGVFARMNATPNTTAQLFNHYFFYGIGNALIISTILMLILKYSGLGFMTIPLPELFLTSLLLSVVTAALGSFTLIFQNKLMLNLSVLGIMYTQMFLTGGVMPSFVSNATLDRILDLMPGEMIRNILIEMQLTGSMRSSVRDILILLLISLAAYMIGAALVQKTWKAV